jgi:hypothetical protein
MAAQAARPINYLCVCIRFYEQICNVLLRLCFYAIQTQSKQSKIELVAQSAFLLINSN